ncbi:MAG: hypothetical protein V1871_08500 [Planctomycetota bacterium]
MKKYYTITILFIITISAVSFYFINNNKELFYKTNSVLLEKVEIIKTSSPGSFQKGLGSPSIEPDNITEEYHLWLKIEMTKDSLEQLIPAVTDTYNTNGPISNTFQNVLVIRGFRKEGNILFNQNETNSNDFGLPLLFSKSITFLSDSVCQLTNDADISNPHIGFDRIDYQTQIYIKSGNDNNLVNLYIHLESNIKPKQLPHIISIALTHIKNNMVIASKTLPLFRY